MDQTSSKFNKKASFIEQKSNEDIQVQESSLHKDQKDMYVSQYGSTNYTSTETIQFKSQTFISNMYKSKTNLLLSHSPNPGNKSKLLDREKNIDFWTSSNNQTSNIHMKDHTNKNNVSLPIIRKSYEQQLKKIKTNYNRKKENASPFIPSFINEHNFRKYSKPRYEILKNKTNHQKKYDDWVYQNRKNSTEHEEEIIPVKDKLGWREQIYSKINNKFSLESTLEEIKNMGISNFIHKLEYIGSRMNYDTRIDKSQFKLMLESLGIAPTKQELGYLFRSLDDDCSGRITFDEVQKLIRMMYRIDYPIYARLFLRIFNLIDIDASGWVDTDELADFINDIGMEKSEKLTSKLIEKYGYNMSFHTFLSLFDFKPDTLLSYNYDPDENYYRPNDITDNLKDHISFLKNFKEVAKKEEINYKKIIKGKKLVSYLHENIQNNINLKLKKNFGANQTKNVENYADMENDLLNGLDNTLVN